MFYLLTAVVAFMVGVIATIVAYKGALTKRETVLDDCVKTNTKLTNQVIGLQTSNRQLMRVVESRQAPVMFSLN